jgi:hypothetical protein
MAEGITIGWVKPGPVDREIEVVFNMLPKAVNVSTFTTFWSLKMANTKEFDRASFENARED